MSKAAIHASATSSAPVLRLRGRPLLLALLILFAVAVAMLRLTSGESFGWPGRADILRFRIMDLLAGTSAGCALAVSGVGLQALLRNPLAEPFILGISSGAALGLFVQALVRLQLGITVGANHVGALLGAMTIMAIVFAVSRRRGIIDPLGMLLSGVVLGSICAALIMALNYWVGPGLVKENISQWMMGYLNQALTMGQIIGIGVAVLAGAALLLGQARAMDAASFSDAEALSMGVNLRRLRAVLFAVSSALAAAAVVLAGPIAFVGLIAPHMARLIFGPSHRMLLIASALIGATMIVLANTASIALNMRFHLGMIPIGVFTALLGGPLFLWMLRPRLGRQ